MQAALSPIQRPGAAEACKDAQGRVQALLLLVLHLRLRVALQLLLARGPTARALRRRCLLLLPAQTRSSCHNHPSCAVLWGMACNGSERGKVPTTSQRFVAACALVFLAGWLVSIAARSATGSTVNVTPFAARARVIRVHWTAIFRGGRLGRPPQQGAWA